MMRKRISRDIGWVRYIFILIIAVTLFNLVRILIAGNITESNLTGSAVFISISTLLYFLFGMAKIVEFDEEYMYIIRKKVVEKVPLKNIYKIKLTMTKINNNNLWKVGYINEDKLKKSVRFLPKWTRSDFKEFKEKVKTVNKDVEIKSWSHSFDFDQ